MDVLDVWIRGIMVKVVTLFRRVDKQDMIFGRKEHGRMYQREIYSNLRIRINTGKNGSENTKFGDQYVTTTEGRCFG